MEATFVYKTDPLHTQRDVHRDALLSVFFNVDLNVHTVTTETIILFNSTEQVVEEVELDYSMRHLKIKPVKWLKPKNHYHIKLIGGEKGLKDITGSFMAATYEWEFHSKDVDEVKPPIITSPNSQSEVSEAVTLKWNPVERAVAYEFQVSRSPAFSTIVWPTTQDLTYGDSIKPSFEYKEGTYYIRGRSIDSDGVKSAYSQPIAFYYSGQIDQGVDLPIDVEPTEPIDETPVDPGPIGEGIVLEDNKGNLIHVTLRTKSQDEEELNHLSSFFKEDPVEGKGTLKLIQSSPKADLFHLPNSLIRTIKLKFSEEINEESVTQDSLYLLKERN